MKITSIINVFRVNFFLPCSDKKKKNEKNPANTAACLEHFLASFLETNEIFRPHTRSLKPRDDFIYFFFQNAHCLSPSLCIFVTGVCHKHTLFVCVYSALQLICRSQTPHRRYLYPNQIAIQLFPLSNVSALVSVGARHKSL